MFLHSHNFLGKSYLKPEIRDDGYNALNIEASGEMELLTVSALELASCVLPTAKRAQNYLWIPQGQDYSLSRYSLCSLVCVNFDSCSF